MKLPLLPIKLPKRILVVESLPPEYTLPLLTIDSPVNLVAPYTDIGKAALSEDIFIKRLTPQ